MSLLCGWFTNIFVLQAQDLSSQQDAITASQNCIDDIRSWTEHDKLVLNDEKTEFFVIGARQQLSKVKYFFDHRGKLCYNEIVSCL